ncbi:hypothetical protein D9M68_366900 [compost metagenome]
MLLKPVSMALNSSRRLRSRRVDRSPLPMIRKVSTIPPTGRVMARSSSRPQTDAAAMASTRAMSMLRSALRTEVMISAIDASLNSRLISIRSLSFSRPSPHRSTRAPSNVALAASNLPSSRFASAWA